MKNFINRQIYKLLFFARNLSSRRMIVALKKICSGYVLDIGGGDFYAGKRKLNFEKWFLLEHNFETFPQCNDERCRLVIGDGCSLPFSGQTFDTVLNIQVLEHVFDPRSMLNEISRVLKKEGKAVFLIPHNGSLHMAPQYYYNFSKFWILKAMEEAGLEVLSIEPIGGFWASLGSRLVFFFLHSFRFPGMSMKDCRRNIFFYFIFPFMAIFALASIPVCLFFSLGDLKEEPNNYLVVARRS